MMKLLTRLATMAAMAAMARPDGHRIFQPPLFP